MIGKAGDIAIVKLNLITASNVQIDISKIFADIQLNEDLFSNTLKGILTINDHLDLLSTIPLIGGEIIELECFTPGLETKEDKVSLKFQIHKISNRVRTSADSQVYNVHIATPEFIVNEVNKISTYLSGNVASSVEKIFHNEKYLNSPRPLSIPEIPDNQITFTTPYWTPFKIINALAARSIRKKDRTADFIFFETITKGFQFLPITKLFESGDTVFRYGNTGVYNDGDGYDINKDYSTVRSVYVDEVFDLIKKAQSGFFNARLLTANLTTKSLFNTSITQDEYFPKYSHLNTEKPDNNVPVSKNATMFSFVNQEYSFNNQRDLNFQEWFLQRINFFSGLTNTYKLNIHVPGRFDVGIGRMVTLDFEMIRKHNTDENTLKEITENSSGRFLITSVNHIITVNNRHYMTLELVTDSLVKR